MEKFEGLNFGWVTRYVAQHAEEVHRSETFNELAKWLAIGTVAAMLENFHYRDLQQELE
jgi:hypothetical protein